MDGSLVPHTRAQPAQLKVELRATFPPGASKARRWRQPTPFVMLRREAQRKTLDEYSELCGVPRAEIENLAREFTSHGKRAAADAHGGTMSGSGIPHRLRHCHAEHADRQPQRQGRGLVLDAGQFGPFGPGPRYNFAAFEGRAKPAGLALSRNRMPYEKSSEFKRKKESGANPYPAQAPWYPATGNRAPS